MFKNILKNKAFKIGGLVLGILIVIAAAVYFFVLPGKQADDYITSSKEKQQQLNSAMNEVAKILESDTFVDVEITSAQMVSDVKSGLKAVETADKVSRDVNEDLRSYKPLPLTNWSSKQKQAIELRDKEIEYTDKSSQLLIEARSILVFVDDYSKVSQKTEENLEFLDFSKDLSTDEIADGIQKIASGFKTAANDLKSISVPKDFKAMYNNDLKLIETLTRDLELYSKAIRELNIDEITRLETKTSTDMEAYSTKNRANMSKIIRDSEFSRSVLNLQDLNNSLRYEI